MIRRFSLRQMCILISTAIIAIASLAFLSYRFGVTTSLGTIFNIWYTIPRLTLAIFGSTNIFLVALTIIIVLLPAVVVNYVIRIIITHAKKLDSEC